MPTDPPPSGVLDPRTLPLHLIASALVLNPRRHGIERLVVRAFPHIRWREYARSDLDICRHRRLGKIRCLQTRPERL